MLISSQSAATVAAVCSAIASSSSVGTTITVIGLSARDTTSVVRMALRASIEHDAERLEAVADTTAHRRAVFTDAAGEDQRVAATEHGEVRPDVLLHAVAEHGQRQGRCGITRGGTGGHLTHVGDTGQALQARSPC